MLRHKPSPVIVLAVISFGVFVAADDLTVVSTMLRQIIFDLEIPLPEGLDDAAWIVNAYLIGYVVVMPFVGRVSDILGRRLVFTGALVLFLIGSIWVPLTDDLPTFIAGRVLTALGGGAMVPVGMAIISDIFVPKRRPSALGILAAVDTLGWIWGPIYGAFLIRYLDWRWQFYLNIPLSIIGISAAWWALRDLPTPRVRTKIDWVGTVTLSGGLLALCIGLLNSSDIQSVGSLNELTGQGQSENWPYYLLALIFLGTFVVTERRLANQNSPQVEKEIVEGQRTNQSSVQTRAPLIDLNLFRYTNVMPAMSVNFLVGAVLIIVMINVPLLVNVLDFEVQRAAVISGALLSAMTASMAIASYAGGRLTERWGYRVITVVGLVAITTGLALLGLTWTVDTPYLMIAWQLAILGLGFGLVFAPIAAAVVNAAPEYQRGIASSLVIVFRLIGMTVGLSSLTAWGLYRFGVLRQQIDLPPINDASFQSALIEGLTRTTVAVLTETFVISAVVAFIATLISLILRKDEQQAN